MSDRPDINAIFDRIANRNATDGDIEALRQSILASVAIGGNVQDATIVTGDDNIIGDRNTVQIGKYNINIAEGSNIKIGDTTYQGANAETIRTIFLEVLANKVVIDNTFSRLFSKSESSEVDWDWGMKLLKQKQLPEIRKRLTDTLGRDRILMDVSIEEQQNWVNRSPLAADRTLQINGKNCGTLDANKMLIETFGRDDIEGKLLILGAPGAGKTTALLSLAEQLVYGAISQPRTVIPVIFELSTWQNDNQSIQSWLIEQLYDLHGGNRKSKLYEQWLERQVLLPLLDGLDELGLERQKKCTEKLNEFAEHYPQLVVCCRVKEFEAVDIKLRNLRGAVCLQSLSDSQIQDYLSSLKRPELWEAIQTTPSLQAMLELKTDGDPGLLRVPLFVKLVADVYDPQQPISSKADLLDKYIDRQLSFDKREIDRRKELDEYKWSYITVELEPDCEIACSHFNWLARNLQTDKKVDFLIEHLQPSSIQSRRLQGIYRVILGLISGSILGLIASPFFESFNVLFVLPVYVLFFGIGFGVIVGCGNIKFVENLTISMANLYSIFLKLITALIFSIIIYLIIPSVGMIGGLVVILPIILYRGLTKTIDSEEENIMNTSRFQFAAMAGFWISGMIKEVDRSIFSGYVMLTLMLAISIFFELRRELKERNKPSQGLWNSLRIQICFVIIVFLLLLSVLIVFSCPQYWLLGLSTAFTLGFFLSGGSSLVQHLSLRIVLWRSGLPWNFARFLNYCVERRLLLRVGGSYRFLHRELLDHFAQSSR
jgi:hypothetical protein